MPSISVRLDFSLTTAGLHAQIMGQGDGVDDVSVIHAPFSLVPTPFPRSEFELVQRSMPLFSSLVHTISQDSQYLATTLRAAAQYDDFTGSLLAIFQETAEAREKLGSRVSLGLHRSDYMLDEPSTSLLQVRLLLQFTQSVLLSAEQLVICAERSNSGESSRVGRLAGGAEHHRSIFWQSQHAGQRAAPPLADAAPVAHAM